MLVSPNPGPSSCRYLGDTSKGDCKKDPMDIDALPKECSSFFYDGFTVNSAKDPITIDLANSYDDAGNEILLQQNKYNSTLNNA